MTSAYAGDIETARDCVERTLDMSRTTTTDNPWLKAVTLMNASVVEFAAGDLTASRTFGEQALEASRATGAPIVLVTCLLGFVATLLETDDIEEARRVNDEALTISEATAMAWHVTYAHLNGARLAASDGKREEAEDLAHQALVRASTMDDYQRTIECFELLAALAADAESYQEAARLVAAAAALREHAGYQPMAPDRVHLEDLRSRLHDALGEDEFARVHYEGLALDMAAAVAYARRGRGERRRPSSGWSSLTPAELDVVRLVSEGLTNPQVAERLFITRATVKAHLGHIFPKLGVTSRAELAAVATRHGIAADTHTS